MKTALKIFFLSFIFIPLHCSLPEQCSIYCGGAILEAIQNANIYSDSKTFVDMPLKYDPAVVMQAFNNLPNKTTPVLIQFLNDNFMLVGSELQTWTFSDWNPSPAFLLNITDVRYRDFGMVLNRLWNLLGKKVIDDVAIHPQRYSIFPQQHPFIVPGQRFREFYYWDSYWIVKGLLACGMNQTARGILLNTFALVMEFGFVPNGARVYYLTRSQPPLLSEMVLEYFLATQDTDLLTTAIPILNREYNYWMSTHTVTLGNGYVLNRYYSESKAPRPESYREDVNKTIGMTPEQAQDFYSNTIACAESGEDFSSRWFTSGANLNTIHALSFIPVDLNSILYKFESNMVYFYSVLKIAPQIDYNAARLHRREAMDRYLWNSTAYEWFDYFVDNSSQIFRHYPSNFYPIWAGAYNTTYKDKLLASIKNSDLIKVGGVLTTHMDSGQQWDFPNAWAPHQSLLVAALRTLGTPSSLEIAEVVALQWIGATFIGYQRTYEMQEKYNALYPGQPGTGGEYPPQAGFGWTNGVTLEFLQLYGNVARSKNFVEKRK